MELILVRHTAVDVLPGLCYGQLDVPLRSSFAEEADRVNAQLQKIFAEGAPTATYSSPLSRCRRLAAACGYAEATLDDRLKELNFGVWEGQIWDQIQDPHLQLWYEHWQELPARGGESHLDQRRRFEDFLCSLDFSERARVLIFTHGGILAIARSLLGGVPIKESMGDVPPYGSVVRLNYRKSITSTEG